jgi:hypothetical protein
VSTFKKTIENGQEQPPELRQDFDIWKLPGDHHAESHPQA